MKIDKAKIREPLDIKEERKQARPSVFTESHRGEYYNLATNKLMPFHKQARRHFDEDALKQMAETIATHGIRQPLTVIPSATEGEGKYEIVSGERRFRAAIIAGLSVVPCIIIHDHKAATEIALIENVQRKDLHPLELANAYRQLIDENIFSSHHDIAKRIGVTRSSVTEILGLLKLPVVVQDALLAKVITSRDFFRELPKAEDEQAMLKMIQNYAINIEQKNSDEKNNIQKRKKIILKVTYDGNEFYIDKAHLSLLSAEDKDELYKKIGHALK